MIQQRVDAYDALSPSRKEAIAAALCRLRRDDLQAFLTALRKTLDRAVKCIYIIPLHGSGTELASIDDAIAFLRNYDETRPARAFVRYEVNVRYTNGDEIRGTYRDKNDAINFLRKIT